MYKLQLYEKVWKYIVYYVFTEYLFYMYKLQLYEKVNKSRIKVE